MKSLMSLIAITVKRVIFKIHFRISYFVLSLENTKLQSKMTKD